MGTTTKGIPYPENTDPVANGADAVKALADWMEANGPKRVHAGVVDVVFTASGISAGVVITFPSGKFSAAPAVCATVHGSSAYFAYTVTNITSIGFTLAARHYLGTSTTVTLKCSYIAMQVA